MNEDAYDSAIRSGQLRSAGTVFFDALVVSAAIVLIGLIPLLSPGEAHPADDPGRIYHLVAPGFPPRLDPKPRGLYFGVGKDAGAPSIGAAPLIDRSSR